MTILFVGFNHFHSLKWIRVLAALADRIVIFVDRPFEGLPANCVQRCYRSKSLHKLDFCKRVNQSLLNELYYTHKPALTFVASVNKPTSVLDYRGPLIFQSWGTDIVRDRHFPTFRQAFLLPRLFRAAIMVWTSSPFHNHYTRGLMHRPGLVATIPFGVEEMFFKKGGAKRIGSNVIQVVFLKHLLPKYGPLDAVALAERLDQRRFRFVIAGRGRLEKEVRARVEHERLTNVVLPGFLGRDEVLRLLEESHVMISPSRYQSETLGVACLEAAARYVPAVGYRIGGLPASVMDGETGLLCEPANVGAMADAIERLCEAGVYEKYSANAGKLARKYYRMKDIATQWVHPLIHATAGGDWQGMYRLVESVNATYSSLRLDYMGKGKKL